MHGPPVRVPDLSRFPPVRDLARRFSLFGRLAPGRSIRSIKATLLAIPRTVVSEAYRAQLAQPYPGDPQGTTWASMIAAHLAQLALSNEVTDAIAAA